MNKLALITGATSGIGKAFAERLVVEGYDLILVGRNQERLDAFATSHPDKKIRTISADLSMDAGIHTVSQICAIEPLTMLINNAGVAHYMPFDELPIDKVREVLQVKTVTPTMLAHAAVKGMKERGRGDIINVAGMIAFSGPMPAATMPRRTVYGGCLAYLVSMTQLLSAELEGTGVNIQVLCPGVIATEFHTRQGLDLSAIPRMSAEDVVTASLKGLELQEVVTIPGVEDFNLLESILKQSELLLAPKHRNSSRVTVARPPNRVKAGIY